jgi:hypothetical protein
MYRRPQSPLLYDFQIPDISSLWACKTSHADFSIYVAVFLYFEDLNSYSKISE